MSFVSKRVGDVTACVVGALLLAACSTTSTASLVPTDIHKIERINKIILIDARPEESKKSRMLSTSMLDCDFGVVSTIEESYPDKLGRLERDLFEAFGEKIEGATVTVRKYAGFSNRAAETGNQAVGIALASVGVFGGGQIPANLKPKCSKEEMNGGWFDPADLNGNVSPVTQDISIELFGKIYSANFAISPPGTGLIDPNSEDLLEQQMSKYLHQRLVAEIRQDIQ
jgi:hypothetical protein